MPKHRKLRFPIDNSENFMLQWFVLSDRLVNAFCVQFIVKAGRVHWCHLLLPTPLFSDRSRFHTNTRRRLQYKKATLIYKCYATRQTGSTAALDMHMHASDSQQLRSRQVANDNITRQSTLLSVCGDSYASSELGDPSPARIAQSCPMTST